MKTKEHAPRFAAVLLAAALLLTGCGGKTKDRLSDAVLAEVEKAASASAAAESAAASAESPAVSELEEVEDASSVPENTAESAAPAQPVQAAAKHVGESAALNGVTLTLEEVSRGSWVYEAPDNVVTFRFEIVNNSGKSVWHGHLISIQDDALMEDVQAGFEMLSDFKVSCDSVTLVNAQDASYAYSNAEMEANDDWGELEPEEPLPDGMTSNINVYTTLPTTAWQELVITYQPDGPYEESISFTVTPDDIVSY